jgi:hypothetical protein
MGVPKIKMRSSNAKDIPARRIDRLSSERPRIYQIVNLRAPIREDGMVEVDEDSRGNRL